MSPAGVFGTATTKKTTLVVKALPGALAPRCLWLAR
jgi:hypothetical protein